MASFAGLLEGMAYKPLLSNARYSPPSGTRAKLLPQPSRRQELFNLLLECVSKRKIRKFEWILRQFKEETRRLSSAKSRVDDAEMAQKTPKLRIREFLRHTLGTHRENSA